MAAAAEEIVAATVVKEAPEPPKELEEDAKKDSSPQIKDTVKFLTPDTTMNILASTVGNVLMPMTEGGLSNLDAGARANVGIKSGRYLFEAKTVEQMSQHHSFVRVGFSAEGSLFLGEDDNSIGFESTGKLVCSGKSTACSQKFHRDVVVAVLLNLDAKSPNYNTISLFKDGKRACQPQPLPESLQGKTLYPAVSFQGASVHVNFGAPIVPLPFKCRSVQEAAQSHAVVTKLSEPADGMYNVVFPVGLPDEGAFDWLDSFLEKNPSYTEISERSLVKWSVASGLKPSGRGESNDRQASRVGLKEAGGIKRSLMGLAALQPRNFVIMEMKGNLIKDERAKAIALFRNASFKTVAEVVVGEPTSAFKKTVQAMTLKAKQDKSDKEHKAKYIVEKREWAARKKTKENEKLKKKQAKEKAKKAEEEKKKRAEALAKQQKLMAAKKAAAEAAAKGEEAPAEEDEKEEEKPEEKVESEDEPDEPEEPEPVETTAPTVTLAAEEKAVHFFKHPMKDLAEKELALSFTKFALPEAGEFSEVKYSWAKETDAAAYVKKWILERKQTIRVEDITPSAWFKQRNSAWQSESGKWARKHNEYKQGVAKKAAEKQQREQRKVAAEKKAKAEAERKAKEAAEKKEGDAEKAEEKAVEEAPAVVEEEMEQAEEPEVDLETIDAFGVEDIMDVGGKTPLFRDFGLDDFAMMTLRFELHLLAHSFAKDCNDPDRTGIHLDHLQFYYEKYYGKALHYHSYGVSTAAELLALVNDCIVVNNNAIASLIPADLESFAVFAKVTEAARRQRHLQVDMGVESARLKIKSDVGQAKANHDGQGQGQKRAWGNRDGGKEQQKGAWGFAGKGGFGGKGKDMGWDAAKGFGKDKGGAKGFAKNAGAANKGFGKRQRKW